MNKKLLWLSLAFAAATITHAATPDASKAALSPSPQQLPMLQPLPQEAQAAYLVAGYLTHAHYKAVPLDDAMSGKIFDRYLKELDPDKLFFTQADIDQFAGARDHLDDAIYNHDLHIPFLIFNLYEQRLTERLAYARSLLKQKFDFTQKESYQYLRDKASWPKSEDEMHDLWRKRVKNDWLRLKLAGNDDKNIVATLEKRYDNYLQRAYKAKSEDVFQDFLEAYAQSTDPHTDYFGPRESEEFDISMKLSLVGIGAVLQERDDYITIREVVPGSPAALSGKIKVGDRIVGVAQGESAPLAEVIGWRLDDTVALIRGALDSTVVLDVLPQGAGPDGKHKMVSLIRKKIVLEQQVAKQSIVDVKDGNATRRIGVISLPVFYTDFNGRQQGDKDYRSATRDVAALLAQLKKEKVDGVLIDLRNNGGGALDEAVDLTGLFINKGPVVQQRFSQGQIRVENSHNAPVWDGPLAVLINRASASASEIFAAAIQDYGRGLIIGEPSFGKGTVQSLVDLDRMAHNDQQKFGELKLTTAQFFRINGGTTQLRGVTPDVAFPTSVGSAEFGESSFDNALPWTQIKPADYASEGDLSELLPLLQLRHDQRVKNDKEFQYLQDDIAEFNALRKKNLISLNESERRAERDAQEAKLKAREKGGHNTKEEKQVANSQHDDGLQANERNLETELAEEKAQKEAKDVLLNEAAHVVSDEVDLLKNNTRLATRVLPGTSMQGVTK